MHSPDLTSTPNHLSATTTARTYSFLITIPRLAPHPTPSAPHAPSFARHHSCCTPQNQLHPWGVKVLPTQLVVAPPQPLVVQPTFVIAPFDNELTISAAQPLASRSAVSGDVLGSTWRWLPAGGGSAYMQVRCRAGRACPLYHI